jgi:hypothetical protein
MADRVLFIGWGEVVRGREERALEVFDETVGFYGRCQQDGRIERFDVVLLQPNGGLTGYMELHATAEQLGALREDEAFQRVIADASLVVDDLTLADGMTDAAIARQLQIFRDATAKVPQAH